MIIIKPNHYDLLTKVVNLIENLDDHINNSYIVKDLRIFFL